MKNCVFKDQRDGFYCINQDKANPSLIIDGCVFYNSNRGIFSINSRVRITNTIFHETDNIIFNFTPDYTYKAGGSGYNCIFGASTVFQNTDSLSSTDITDDPQFIDAVNGDFRLKISSPCLNTGKITLGNGKITMGAWQPFAVPDNPKIRSRYDFEDIYN